MSPKELTAFRMAPDVMAALRAVKAKEGIPVAVQIDFAVRAWLKKKGVTLKPERKAGGHPQAPLNPSTPREPGRLSAFVRKLERKKKGGGR